MPEVPPALDFVTRFGSFGLLAIAVVWMLYYGAPMIRDTIKSLGESHEKAVQRVADEMKATAKENTEAVKVIVAEHTKQVQTMDANCRQERIQLAQLLAHSLPGPEK